MTDHGNRLRTAVAVTVEAYQRGYLRLTDLLDEVEELVAEHVESEIERQAQRNELVASLRVEP